MKALYFLWWLIFGYSSRLFYRKIVALNSKRNSEGSTIFISNHPASFMDPLIVSRFNNAIVFFLTRSDVFTKFTNPFFKSAHMLPIYRQQDGGKTNEKNKEVFKKCSDVLMKNKNILIFGEGLTDDVFIRRVKPLKKGALRIGFTALESCNWEKKIYISLVGINYTQANLYGSDILLSNSDKICLNDYREAFEENPSRTISAINRDLELILQDQLTHVESEENVNLHEDIMMLTRKGMHPICFDKQLSLEERWNYSKSLATWLNKQETSDLDALKSLMIEYRKRLSSTKITENNRYLKANNKWKLIQNLCRFIILFPMALLGILHAGIPYFLLKKFVEKSFKRDVFWASVKMILGVVIIGLINLPILFLGSKFFPCLSLLEASIYVSLYYLSIGIFAYAAYECKLLISIFWNQFQIRNIDLAELNEQREIIINTIHQEISL